MPPAPPAAAPSPSPHPGLGAVVTPGGTSFRVWAPFAKSVAVAGDFNGWSETAHPLAAEDGGLWSALVPGVGAGAAYQFVIVNRDSGNVFWRIDPRARAVSHSAGDGLVESGAYDWRDDDYRTPPWDEWVIYELHVGTFNDRPGGGPGSFDSIVDRLDALADLGIDCIEVMPSMEFSTDFSWGYNPAHLYALESAYGGPAAFQRLVEEAHRRGIAVLFDVVYNHLGPSDLDLWQFDGWTPNGKGGIYFYNDWRSRTPWGDTRPDYGREEVRRFLHDNVRMWLEELRLDGLRWDATAWIRNRDGEDGPWGDIPEGWALMQRITGDTGARQPWKMHIAEDLRHNEHITRPAEAGGAGFGAQWDADFAHVVRRAVIAADDGERDVAAVAHAVGRRYNGEALQRVIYTESHDEVANGRARVPQEIWPGNAGSWFSRKRSTLGAALVFTAPGIPMLFQGQEVLEDEFFRDGDPVDWTKERTFAGIRSLYRDLVRLRRNWWDTTRGLRGGEVNVHHVNQADKVLAFHRWSGGGPRDDVVVVANFANRGYGDYVVGLPRGGRWRVRFNSDWQGYGEDYAGHPSFDLDARSEGRDGMPWSGAVGVGPYTAVVLSQDD